MSVRSCLATRASSDASSAFVAQALCDFRREPLHSIIRLVLHPQNALLPLPCSGTGAAEALGALGKRPRSFGVNILASLRAPQIWITTTRIIGHIVVNMHSIRFQSESNLDVSKPRLPVPTKMRAQCPKLGRARGQDSIIILITTYNIYTQYVAMSPRHCGYPNELPHFPTTEFGPLVRGESSSEACTW